MKAFFYIIITFILTTDFVGDTVRMFEDEKHYGRHFVDALLGAIALIGFFVLCDGIL